MRLIAILTSMPAIGEASQRWPESGFSRLHTNSLTNLFVSETGQPNRDRMSYPACQRK
jgi:hypothetical protein